MNAEIVYRIEESLARDRWLNDMMVSGNEGTNTELTEDQSALIIAPEGISEEQFMRVINDVLNEERMNTLEKIASRFRQVDGKYIPFNIESDESTKE